MIVYLLISIFVAYHNAEAAPILLAARADAPPSSIQLKRTLFGVIWSCLSTIIICAWTSVHPNVPPLNKWKARRNRVMVMFWMIVAPELVLAWAVRQFFAARELRDAYNQSHPELPEWKKWTLIHGHMAGMGGFVFADPDEKDKNPREQAGRVLSFDQLKQLLQSPDFKFPIITAEDIQDRSKADALWKIIAILQTTWFILQCIARGHQRLALTELELVTLALASLNAITFAIWWHKPLGVQEPIRIHVKLTEVPMVDNDAEENDQGPVLSARNVISKAWDFFQFAAAFPIEFLLNPLISGLYNGLTYLFILLPFCILYIATFPFFILFPLGTVLLLRIIKAEPVPQEESQNRGFLAARIVTSLQRFRYRLSSAITEFVETWLRRIFDVSNIVPFLFGWYFLLPLLFVLLTLFTIFLTPFLTLLFLVSFIFTAVFGIVTTSTIRLGASHVPSFYAPNTDSDRWSRMIVFAIFGVIFGGLHCIGWNFQYPSHSEQILWRATSLAITVIPLIVAPIDFLLATRLVSRDIRSCGRVERTVLLIFDLIMTIFLFVYVPARLSLIAQALALLRNQPEDALIAVDWTKYVPHMFSSS